MTTMIPKSCSSTDPATLKLYETLYNQLGPDYKVIQHFDLSKKFSGSLFWIQHNHQSLFLYLSHSTEKHLSFDKSKKNSAQDLLQNQEIIQLLKLQEQLLPNELQSHKTKLAPLLIVFSNIHKDKVTIGLKKQGLYLLGKESLQEDRLGKLIYNLLGEQYSPAVHHYIRHIFSPETLITSHKKIEISQIANNLLDNGQEVAMKADISLPADKRRATSCNITGINGGASSGKTEALIRRAKLFRQSYPENSTLILTINKPSQILLKKSYLEISPDDKKTDILCFKQWCKENLKPSSKLVYIDDVMDIIEFRIGPQLKKNGISLPMFLHELDYIHSRAIFHEKDYIKSTQTAQPYHLNGEHYPHIWKATLILKDELSARALILWSELPKLLWNQLEKDPFTKNYDHVLVDDSQHFPPIAFELFKKVIKPKTGQLFITQDPDQGFMNPCILWRDTGLDLRNHSTRLNHFHGINPYVLNATNAFYLNRLPENTDKYILQDLPLSNDKPIPELLHFHTDKDEQNRLINEVKKHIQIGHSPQDILIITIDNNVNKQLSVLLESTLDTKVNILDENLFQNYQQRNGIGVCNIMHALGINAPYVFIFGLQQLFEAEKSIEVGTREHQVLLRENTHKLSNAMARARKKLTLFITTDIIPEAFLSPHIKIPTANTTMNAEVRYLQNSE